MSQWSAVYHHFGSKAGLFRAVYDELVAGTSERIAAALMEAGVMIATAPDPARARTGASASARYLIAGLQRTPVPRELGRPVPAARRTEPVAR